MKTESLIDSPKFALHEAFAASLPDGGIDPRYSDDFLLVKREIDKLQDNDYGLVQELCCALLTEQAKDLRVAGYLLIAAVARAGLAGLLDAAAGFRLLLSDFWDICHPRRDSARLAALSLLNGTRFEALTREAGRAATIEQLTALRRVVDDINTLLRGHFGDEALQWRALDGWLKVKLQAPRLVETSATTAPPAPAVTAVESSPAQADAATGRPGHDWTIRSEREAHALTCALSTYYREQGAQAQALAYTRALRWGGLCLPSAVQGRTRVSAPRSAAVAALENQQRLNDPEALLELCESLFLEPGGQFWLDLQYVSWEAAKASGSVDLALFYAEQSRFLLRRFPSLADLSFDDGRPFADPATRAWLDELLRESSPAQLNSCVDAGTDDWGQVLTECLRDARELAARKKLSEALGLLDQLKVDNQERRLRLQLARVALCLHEGRADVALPLVDALEEEAESCRLILWNQSLALEIWRQVLDVLRDCVRKAPAEEKTALDNRARQLRARICRTSPAAAVRWL